MGLFSRSRTEPTTLVAERPDWLPAPGVNVQPPARDRGFQLEFGLQAPGALLEQIASTFSSTPVSRSDALSVPAVLRARNMVASIPATLPIFVYARDFTPDTRNTIVTDPHAEIPSAVMYAQTFEDLFLEGLSYWRVTRFVSGFPVEGYHVDLRSVSQPLVLGAPSRNITNDHKFGPEDPIFIDGIPVPSREMIRFVSPNPPFLTHGARAIRTALLLDKVASMYAEDPMPLGYFTDVSGMPPLADEEVQAALDRWTLARRRRAFGYVPSGLQLETPQWNAEQIQLADARQHAVLEIARAAGIDPEDVGVSTTSRTYQNAEQRRMDFVSFALMPYMTAVEQRLSKDDVLPHGLRARFDTSSFLRADTKTRMEAYEIGKRAGAYTHEEIRASEYRPPSPEPKPPAPPAPATSEGMPTDE